VSGALRALGVLVLVIGLGAAAVGGVRFAGDTEYAEKAAAYERHQGHPLFQSEYWIASGRHYGYLALALGGLLGGAVTGGLLLGVAELLRRTPPR
jgi:hypothetical protein